MNLLSNPYNVYGQFHNNALDYVIANIPPSNPTIDEVIQATNDYLLSIRYRGSAYDELASAESQVQIATDFNGALSLNEFICSGKFTRKQIDWINILIHPNPTISNSDLAEFYLKTGYDIIVADIPFEEKQVLLIGAAIGNYSCTYWQDQVSNPSSPWSGYLAKSGGSGRLPKWAAYDIGGAIGGGISGALVSWWTGPAISLTTVGLYALRGAVVGSLGAVLSS